MNRIKIIYWASTGLLCLIYFGGAAFYTTQGEMVAQIYGMLGYPTYLISLLIVVKILGPVAILSRLSIPLSDLAYAGMFFHLLLAISAHINAGDNGYAPAVIGLLLMLVSFFTQNAVRKGESPNAGNRFTATA